MPFTYLNYRLSGGFIDHWLTAGPLAQPLPADLWTTQPSPSAIFQAIYDPASEVAEPPVDLGDLGPLSVQQRSLYWRYYACLDDHLVEFKASQEAGSYQRAWAYTELELSAPAQVELALSTHGPADLWLNGVHLLRHDLTQSARLVTHTLACDLPAGRSTILLRLERLTPPGSDSPEQALLAAGSPGLAHPGWGFAAALQVRGLAPDLAQILLPTNIEPELLEKRMNLEEVVQAAYLDRYVFGRLDGDLYDRNQPLTLRFSSDLQKEDEITVRMQGLDASIFQEITSVCQAGSVFELAKTFPLRSGPHDLAFTPKAAEYYQKFLAFERKDPFYIVRKDYAFKPRGKYKERAQAALEDAVIRRTDSLFCEIAKMALKKWETIHWELVWPSLRRVESGQPSALVDLLGFLGMRKRYWNGRYLPKDFSPSLDKAILSFPYLEGGPEKGKIGPLTPTEQILLYACEILAGQLFPQAIFGCDGQPGAWHRQQAENLAVEWMQTQGQSGFPEWDSPASLESLVGALSYLVHLSGSDQVTELATALLDKVFFHLAINTFKGAYGAPHAFSDTGSLLSSRLEPTSGVCRLMFGLGNFNDHIFGTVSLACSRGYRLPAIIQEVAGFVGPSWQLEGVRTRTPGVPTPGILTRTPLYPAALAGEVNKVVYKTSDFMLSSVQDFTPGQLGEQEHAWQATLGPDAVVFTNHPVCQSEAETRAPNYWRGNGVLPRIAQWGDVLVCLYQLPADDWLGYTHAYFPAVVFDEYEIGEKWAFGRSGEAYLALYAQNGLEFIRTGKSALRELRSPGLQNTWLCQMGHALLDDNFSSFKEKITAQSLAEQPGQVRLHTLRGDDLSFAWVGAFLVNGKELPLAGFPQYDNQYCSVTSPVTEMVIRMKEKGLRLSFT